MSILAKLRDRFREALADFAEPDDLARLLDLVRPSQGAQFGDYQANCAMPLAKLRGEPARELAERIVERLEVDDLCESPEVAGPGFINLRLRESWLIAQLQQAADDPRLGVAPAEQPRRFVIDYSSPNVAKPMHVGHIRSTVIGDALKRILTFQGHTVIADNHLGDWGTQFGMIIYGYKHFVDPDAYRAQPVAELSRIYRLVHELMEYHNAQRELPELQRRALELQTAAEAADAAEPLEDKKAAKKAAKALKKARQQAADAAGSVARLQQRIAALDEQPERRQLAEAHPDINQAVLRETAKLHEGDEQNRRLWDQFLPACRAEIQRVYDRLNIQFDYEYGESFYHSMLADVVADLEDKGLARESEGAMCIFLDDFATPMIVRKQDGAFLYATTDLATIRYRLENWQPDAMLYVVDHRQSEHFEKLFTAARKWGVKDVEMSHISFGTVLGKDGKPFKTKSGATVGLEGLLDQAVARAAAVVKENNAQNPPDARLDAEALDRVADVVGHAAIRYADLSHNRTSDYEFSYDKMLALEGNTATYMQYSYARTQSIFRKGEVDPEQLRARNPKLILEHPLERALALEIARFPETLEEAMVDYRPNILTTYLFTLAQRFHQFFAHPECHVLKAEAAVRDSRLGLCDLTGRTIRQGLALLGIDVVQRM